MTPFSVHGNIGANLGGFHEILGTILVSGTKTYSEAQILDGLQDAYTKWDASLGPKIWAVSRQWLVNAGMK